MEVIVGVLKLVVVKSKLEVCEGVVEILSYPPA